MMRWMGWALILAIVVWASVAGVNWLGPRIEQDVASRVNTRLAETGLLFATAQAKGREVTVVGDAPDAEARDKALSAAAQVLGVAKVLDGMSVSGVLVQSQPTFPEEALIIADTKTPAKEITKPSKDYVLRIVKQGEQITLDGMVPDSATRRVLMRLATDRYGAEYVHDKMTVAAGAPEGWRSAAGAVLINLSNLEKATAVISNTEVMVDGEVLDQRYADTAEDNMKKAMPTNYRVAYGVDTVLPMLAQTEPSFIYAEIEPSAGPQTQAGKEIPQGKEAGVWDKLWERAGQALTSCSASHELKIHKVMFGFDSAKVGPVYGPTLDKVAGIMQACAGLEVVVAGHTDHAGSPLYNQWLSEQRAEAALRALLVRGVAAERLSAKGYGEYHPVGDNKTRAGRAANRRVEFTPATQIKLLDKQEFQSNKTDKSAHTKEPSSSPSGSWWDRVSGAINRAEKAVSETVVGP